MKDFLIRNKWMIIAWLVSLFLISLLITSCGNETNIHQNTQLDSVVSAKRAMEESLNKKIDSLSSQNELYQKQVDSLKSIPTTTTKQKYKTEYVDSLLIEVSADKWVIVNLQSQYDSLLERFNKNK